MSWITTMISWFWLSLRLQCLLALSSQLLSERFENKPSEECCCRGKKIFFLVVKLNLCMIHAHCLLVMYFCFASKSVQDRAQHSGRSLHRRLGLMAVALPVVPLYLVHMGPFYRLVNSWGIFRQLLSCPFDAYRLLRVNHKCYQTLLQWKQPLFFDLKWFVRPLFLVFPLQVDYNLQILKGWAFMWHMDCLEMMVAFIALTHFLVDI